MKYFLILSTTLFVEALFSIEIPVSYGELIDKITILTIKQEEIKDRAKLINVVHELNLLTTIYKKNVAFNLQLIELEAELYLVNRRLWDIEEEIRVCEKRQQFDEHFIALARNVYLYNNQRSILKQQINKLLNSPIIEEKSYVEYLDTVH